MKLGTRFSDWTQFELIVQLMHVVVLFGGAALGFVLYDWVGGLLGALIAFGVIAALYWVALSRGGRGDEDSS